MSVRNFESLFQPRSVAVFGASDRPGSVGAVVLANLKAGGFRGPVWPVNPGHATIGGDTAWPDVQSLPSAPDLAIICTPAHTVPGLIAQLGSRGTRAAVVLSAGLKGPAAVDGTTLEQAMLDAARPHLLRILGPNCIGLLVPGIGLNASFAPGNALAGKLAFVSQSGALATAMLDWSKDHGIGFSHFISLGDSADVDFGDVLDYLASDPSTRAILMYAEAVKAGRKFMSAARAAARNKPVIVVKAGRAPDGAHAAASHTGALAGSDAVFDAAARRAGMLRVDTLEDLFDAAETLAHARPVLGERLVILTNGGGAGVLAADSLSAGGGKLAELSAATLRALDACLPATWSRGNPVDIIGDAPITRYQDALRILLAAPEVNAVLFAHAPTALVPAPDIAQACLALARDAAKPVLGCWLGGPAVASARASWSQAGVPCFATPERAVAAWLQMADHARNQLALQQIPADSAAGFKPEVARALALLTTASREGREWLDEVAATQLLQAYGIPIVETRAARDVEEAVRLATEIGFPVALKVMSRRIIHKSDVGGVALNLRSRDEVRAAAIRMRQDVARLKPDASVNGFAVQAMARRPGARELIVGVASDPVFGPVILCGSGGVEVELNRRSAIALPPLNAVLANDLVDRSGVRPLLRAWRSRAPASSAALVDTLLQVSRMVSDLRDVAELDINPLLVDEHGVLALDARIRLHAGQDHAPMAVRPYPESLEETVTIGGAEVLLRPIQPEDGARLHAFYEKASAADMRLRFFMARREVPASELARYSQIDYDREMTFIALGPRTSDGQRPMVGEVRAVCDPDNRVAEFAIQVASAWQGKGLGRTLLAKLIAYLRARGTREVVGECLPENDGMARLAKAMGFEVVLKEDSQSLRLALQRDR